MAATTCGKCIAWSTLTFPPTQWSISFFSPSLSPSLVTSLPALPLIRLSLPNHVRRISFQVPACVSQTKLASCLFVSVMRWGKKVKCLHFIFFQEPLCLARDKVSHPPSAAEPTHPAGLGDRRTSYWAPAAWNDSPHMLAFPLADLISSHVLPLLTATWTL